MKFYKNIAPCSYVVVLLVLVLINMISLGSCQHDPILSDQPQDSTSVIDTITLPKDTSKASCDTTKVYFSAQILPILVSNCAIPQCHDRTSKEDDVIMDSYSNIVKTGEIKAYRWTDSKLYEVLTATEGKKVMPPPPRERLSSPQIAMIKKWVEQGATNDSCTVHSETGCKTANISYRDHVNAILKVYCTGCHNSNGTSGGINLSTHAGVKAASINGKLYNSIAWNAGAVRMPQNQAQLPACYIQQIKAWIDADLPNN